MKKYVMIVAACTVGFFVYKHHLQTKTNETRATHVIEWGMKSDNEFDNAELKSIDLQDYEIDEIGLIHAEAELTYEVNGKELCKKVKAFYTGKFGTVVDDFTVVGNCN
ncbi:hypothetical protein VEL84_003238 [Cronobacter sakazakii]|uniref:hypothetical protein n=1 Tax=Cronobacter sakazakii TaxID=28141 RepID=UPI000A19B3C9|nr:hypothetical protein [Cronobacter sakazakii]EGZ6858218.1 hypothetical protein [Cronobacter sakazakii]EGZ6870284.1 hypothetical protein [Cronobacter sakazakii]ELY2684635.1 hypothetical protein [Cronobacter sakazakii]EMC4284741.1 hypothetical protein [Cronobacter sakazakii]EMC4329081.1 hypothetical protein [Cronobacter sakazakii]